MWTLIFIGIVGFFTFRHFAKKKREKDIRSWSVDLKSDTKLKFPASRIDWRKDK
jgi:hypothetical protein